MVKKTFHKPLWLGVDVGGTKIFAAVIDGRKKVIAEAKKSTRPELGPAKVQQRLVKCVQEALDLCGVPPGKIAGMGVGVPGLVDSRRQVVQIAPNLGWKNIHLRRTLRPRFPFPVVVVNDVEAATEAVHQVGIGKGTQNLVCLFVGTGIGGGLIVRGRPFRGTTGIGAELGHMVLMPEGGPKCGCGNRGCLESLASRTAMVREIRRAVRSGRRSFLAPALSHRSGIRSRDLAQAYLGGDSLVREIVHASCRYLGIACSNLVRILEPEMIVLGGGIMEALGAVMVPRIRAVVRAQAYGQNGRRVKIVASSLADHAGAIGSAFMAQAAFKPPSA